MNIFENIKKLFKTFIFVEVLMLSACSSIHKQQRENKDIQITYENSQVLKGCSFHNSKNAFTLFGLLTDSKIKYDSACTKYSLCILPIDKKHIEVNLLQDKSTISTTKVRGQYSEGYFKIRRWKTKFKAGPLYWALTDQLICLGLNVKNELVVVYTTGGQLFLLFFPFMATQGGDAAYEYQWETN